ncbi:glycoside hydrolase [Aspergillus steynii IBT 23096]|uniref:Glycoside hydrolase n=1 Tax=Aspergillus steynii IBT 23096 TaxID=1392250 RepID=A0A2I2G0X8_9EURO|nr:glycoside hydrolase [Aspergillus steynii IBT 23096]PLB46521.1 glycoside hydrolase [Aspergillus steynii IBT 23096]
MHLFLLTLLATLTTSLNLSSPGDTSPIPSWHLQSSLQAPTNLSHLSLPSTNITQLNPAWHPIPSSHATVMAALLANNIYNTSHLFYSDNMASLDTDPSFQSPWLYRSTITISPPRPDEHILLLTHGITSKADIFFNGIKIASSETQRGSYTGGRYDVTGFIAKSNTGGRSENVVLIKAYPTNYLGDLAQGFIDWNPYPADNGTGVWRDVEVKRTGRVWVSSLRVLTDYAGAKGGDVNVTVKAELVNLENSPVRVTVQGYIEGPGSNGASIANLASGFKLEAQKNTTVSITVLIRNASIWWPAAWGSQPVYTVHLNVSLGAAMAVSDVAKPARFGIRTVSSRVNAHNDTEFSINGHPFRVRGAGYAPDLYLRFDLDRVRTMFLYMLDMGLNTVRLEGNQEHPQLYDLADELGLMVLAGWECCDKWEAWDYAEDAKGTPWTDPDYTTAYTSMLHEAAMMQPHPSLLAFLVGSDYWPNDRATSAYLSALRRMDWSTPVIASASKRGYPDALAPSGMKMDGPYDWVPPKYWTGSQYGAAFGFGSEQGAGVGTPELSSLHTFLSPSELDSLWRDPAKNQYHMSRYDSSFYNRAIYNKALFGRYGPPSSLTDYVRKAQMMDYEATRAEFEGFAMKQNASRPATGVVYWMLNSAWPSLHWQLFDYYLRPGGAFFGTKTGARKEHVAFDYDEGSVYLVNHGIELGRGDVSGSRTVQVDLVGRDGGYIWGENVTAQTVPNASKRVTKVDGLKRIRDVAFLRLMLREGDGKMLSRNVYWLSAKSDVLDWENSNWYTTPTKQFADFTALGRMAKARVTTDIGSLDSKKGFSKVEVTLSNESEVPAVFLHLVALDPASREEIAPVYWSDNYVTLFPREKIKLTAEVQSTEWMVVLEGNNVRKVMVGHN